MKIGCFFLKLNPLKLSMIVGTVVFGILEIFAFTHRLNAESVELYLANQTDSWSEVKDKIQSGRRRRGGSRNEICIIAPSQPMITELVWTLKPLFVWKGDIGRVELHLQESEIDAKPLWSWTETGQENTSNYVVVPYDGEPLKPGQVYEWRVFESANSSRIAMPPVQFQVVDSEQHQQIQSELNQLTSSEASSSESMALEQVNYFIEKQLWTDALQEIYETNNSSPQRLEIAEELTSELCRL
ncbi:MAG: DUF928 domain-containing protein [Lyngbya sp.]|nr:DUF928 domain-containing protein [Lyngbya sp.]